MSHPEVSEKGSPQIQGGISDAAKAKALELAHAANPSGHSGGLTDRNIVALDCGMALARFIQEVSDAAKAVEADVGEQSFTAKTYLAPFILSEPVDPLEEALREADCSDTWGDGYEQNATLIREALAKRGLKIVEAS